MDFHDATRLAVVNGASTIVISSVQTIADAAAPARASLDTPLADYSSAGAITVQLQCLRFENGIGVASPSAFESTLSLTTGTSYAVSPAPVITKVTATAALTVTPAGPVTEGDPVTLTAAVTPAAASGEVTLTDGPIILAHVPVSNGTAELVVSDLLRGDHSFTASYFPAETLYYDPSGPSAPVALTVLAPIAVTPTPTPSVTPTPTAGATDSPTAEPTTTPSSTAVAAGPTGGTPVEQFLASTGFAAGAVVIGALLALAAGVVLVQVVRRRRGTAG
ncbi:Ig-like domain repeat protein [Herbiconiux sp. 11R-BC]|uniref:Ig-like domain repeat protein n=1 Tax=Herbiconiux sp. 11R-BC TaxID=3111637 RepID=UPI003C038CA4